MTEIKLPGLPTPGVPNTRAPMGKAYVYGSYNEEQMFSYARSAIALNATPTGMEAPAAEPVAPSANEVKRQVFFLCEATEDLPEQPDGIFKGVAGDMFLAGRKFEAKGIRNAIGEWYRSAATPPTGEVKPEVARGKFEGAQHYANRQKMAVTSQWLAGWDACIEYLATQPPEVKPAPALSDERLRDIIGEHLTTAYACTRVWEAWSVGTMSEDDFVPLGETEFVDDLAHAIQAALAAQEKPNAPALAHPAPAGWMPISSAPQDGFMLVHEDGAIRALMRIKGVWHKPGYPAIVNDWGDAIVGDDAKRLLPKGCRLELRDGCCESPTHWMPIDAPNAQEPA